MNLESYAVIGAGYGDEGKGLLTDHLSRTLCKDKYVKPLVARQNGGAQAGHTVVTQANNSEKTQRHVFRHLGAGTINGSATYLSSSFLVNPISLRAEVIELKSRGINPVVICHDGARVTTIFDMMINQMLEETRGNARHGSCGMGINETIRRCESGFPLSVMICRDQTSLKFALWEIKHVWAEKRLEELGINSVENLTKIREINVDLLAQDYHGLVKHHLTCADPKFIPPNKKPLIIEGAQGLAIDEFIGVFPHVTPSIVGLPSAIKTAKECGRNVINPIYVTRHYATRHGAGPFPHEGEFKLLENDFDKTNVHNEWQGSLRFGLLDANDLANRIKADLDRAQEFANWNHVTIKEPKLLVTCLDQGGEFGHFYWNGQKKRYAKGDFSKALLSHLQQVVPNLQLFGESYGDTSKDIHVNTDPNHI